MDVDLITHIDDQAMADGMAFIDPLSFGEKLKSMPKLVVLSSDDEFMMMDWSNIWYDKLTGESHLLIVPNAEHTLGTNLYGALSSVCAFIKSITAGH